MTIHNDKIQTAFDLYADNGGIIGNVIIYPDGARIYVSDDGPYGRQDLIKIAHRLIDIAFFDTGLRK